MIPAPLNVKLETPSSIDPSHWQIEAALWCRLGKEVGANPAFSPLTVKTFYVLGLIHDFCESVTILLQDSVSITTTYLPAYAVYASGIELLGRCLRGNTDTSGMVQDLKAGFKWLACPSPDNYAALANDEVLVETGSDRYSIDYLVQMRHFAAHGQATSKQNPEIRWIDYEILSKMPPLLARGMETYWSQLQQNDSLCEHLACANIRPFRNNPIFGTLCLIAFHRDQYPSIGSIFQKYDWRVAGYRIGNPAAVPENIARLFGDL